MLSMRALPASTTAVVGNNVSSKSNESNPKVRFVAALVVDKACVLSTMTTTRNNRHNGIHAANDMLLLLLLLPLFLPKRRLFGIFLQLAFMFLFATCLVGIKKGLTHVSVTVIVGNAIERGLMLDMTVGTKFGVGSILLMRSRGTVG